MKKEIKWGLFVTTGIVTLFLIFILFGEFKFLDKGYNLFVTYNFTNGLDKNAPVRLSGVNVGNVDDINMAYDNEGKIHIIVKLWIKENIRLRGDARFYINTLGLLGEKYIEISPGSPGEDMITENSTIVGIDPLSTEELFVKGNEIADNLRSIMNQLNALVTGETIEVILDTMKSITGTMESVDLIFRENRENIHSVTTNMKTASKELPVITSRISGTTRELEEAFEGKGKQLAAIIENLETFSETLEEISGNLKAINSRVEKGEGNLGLLVNDDLIYKNLEMTISEIRKLVEDMRENPKKYIRLTVF